MASMGIDGLSSGLDTTSLINSLMQVEAMPQTLLKKKVSTATTFTAALQALNSRVASLRDAAAAAAKPASWSAVTASSSAPSVTATAGATAGASSLTFTVDRLASAQTSVSAKVTDLAQVFGGTVPAAVTLTSGTGATATATTVDLTGVTTLAGFASAINRSGAGINASVVKVSATESRLQLTGTATGAAGGFDLYSGTVSQAAVADGTAGTPVLARGDAITAAGDATITLFPGTSAQQPVTSATNTFAGVMTGVDVTVTEVETEPVTVSVARDDAALEKLASDLVSALGVVYSEIKSQTTTSTKTGSDGRTVVSGGALSADSATRSIHLSLQSAATYPVDGMSPIEAGIVVERDGTVTFDKAKFAAAMAADPAKVQRVVAGIAARVETAADTISDPIDGTLSLKIKSQEGFNRQLSLQVEDWDRRLAVRREGLQATYTALEVSLSKLHSQQSWLAGQLASLTAPQ